jgi:hypothetical protein
MTDARAKSEQVDPLLCKSVPFLTGEEKFTAWIPDAQGRMGHIIGDVHRELKRTGKKNDSDSLVCTPAPSGHLRTSPDCAALLSKLARGQLLSELLLFAVLALFQWLPSGRCHRRVRHEDKALSWQ